MTTDISGMGIAQSNVLEFVNQVLSQAQVIQEAENHMRAIQCAREIADAAFQSASQYKSTREALRKARIEERKAKEREDLRRKKEAEAAAKREAAAEAKARKKAAEQKRKQEEDKERADGHEEGDTGDADAPKRRRRGQGGEELSPDDYPVLRSYNIFSGKSIKVVEAMNTFVEQCLTGAPGIWRAKRPPFKRVLEAHDDYTVKQAVSGSTAIIAAAKAFTEEFAQILEKEPHTIKKTQKASDEVQQHLEALSLEQQAVAVLEREAENPSLELDEFCMVMDREELKKMIQRVVDEICTKHWSGSTPSEEVARKAKNEQMLYENVQLLGFAKGKSFSGVMSGLYPHLIYQVVGARVIALVDMVDVAWPGYRNVFL